ASQGERLSLLQLNMAMGEPLDSEFEVDSALPPVKLHQSLDQLIEHGKKHRHSYNAASLTDDLAKWGVRATRGSLFPSVAAIYHWQEDSEASLFSGQDSWRAMLNVSFDIPLGLTNVASVQEAKAQHRQSRYLVKQALDGIMMEIEANHLQFQLMAESLEMAIQQMNAAEENYNAIKAGYEIGESIQLELIDARNSLTNAKINLMNTEIDHYISYNRLMYSSGYPIGE
ncbi:MAG: TolC family protein, partial [FCB group bacterium]|nr:TolC family protein [FCB group bacterium]